MAKEKAIRRVRSFYPSRKLIAKLEKMAKVDGRSFSSMVVYLLERAVGSR